MPNCPNCGQPFPTGKALGGHLGYCNHEQLPECRNCGEQYSENREECLECGGDVFPRHYLRKVVLPNGDVVH